MRVIVLAILFGAATAAWACTPELPLAKGVTAAVTATTVDSTKYSLIYRTLPEKIAIGQHFAVELALCAKDGTAAPAAENVRVDAHMPEHRHGMNYKTTVSGSGAGRYRAEGLMFQMPGRWEYIFEVRASGNKGATERITTRVVLP